ncbi:hypothetical protein H5410_058119, partial [Solanum commersonii]
RLLWGSRKSPKCQLLSKGVTEWSFLDSEHFHILHEFDMLKEPTVICCYLFVYSKSLNSPIISART